MFDRNPALSRPQHVLDLHAFTVHALAFIGDRSISLAEAMDTAAAEARRRREVASRPRARLGPRDAYFRDSATHAPTQHIR